jgi:hypothetical protein
MARVGALSGRFFLDDAPGALVKLRQRRNLGEARRAPVMGCYRRTKNRSTMRRRPCV